MARFYPATLKSDIPDSEARVWDAAMNLSDEWVVFHSVCWQSKRHGKPGDGEADFVIVHPRNGIIVIEVKGGRITIEDGSWYSTDRNGQIHEIKNPFEQAKVSKFALIKYLKDSFNIHIPVCHAVVFPNISIDSSISMYGPRPIILDRVDLGNLENGLSSIFKHWEQKADLQKSVIQNIIRLLAPTINVRITANDIISDCNEQLLSLTKQQIRAFQQLRLIRRAAILGGAGTGKTVLAVERARRLTLDGFSTLLTCFNAPLADHIATQFSNTESVRVTTFHSLCFAEARKAGINVQNDPSEEWWNYEAPDILLSSIKKNGTQFDAVIIDEAQDFWPNWILALDLIGGESKNAPFYLFADSHQDLYRRNRNFPEDYPTLLLDINCRNTREIAQRFSLIYSDPDPETKISGPTPVFVRIGSSADVASSIQQTVSRLIEEENLSPKSITVLSDQRSLVDRLHEMLVGDYSFAQWGKYGVVAETIHRFKGLESDVIVLSLSDRLLEDETLLKSLAYVGLSRAKSLLYVFGSKRVRQKLAWD